jgi:hypothetical protein
MGAAFKYGLMGPGTMVSGKMTWLKVTAVSSMPKETSTRELGRQTKLMDMASTPTMVAVAMRDDGWKINRMDRELRGGQMVPNIKVSIRTV